MRLTATRSSANNEQAEVFVHDLDLFVTVQLLDDTPAILLLHKLCSKRGYSYEWKTAKLYDGPKMGRQFTCIMDNSALLVVSRLSSYSSSILSSTSRSKDQSNYFRNVGTLSDPVTT